MDSNSRSASPREPSRPQHRPPSPPSPTAFDNRAYQHDEADQNHNDSFTSNGPQQNGHTKEPNGDTKTLEAVNLELINLTPKNGNAKKKDAVELDMNTSNPYDEYFVPVNEHRKYMRGEKLYVTADKRGEKGGCKRPLCWTLLALVAAVIVALIVLAATGILFSNSPTTVEQYNSSVSSARSFGGLTHDHSQHDHTHDHEHHDHDHDHEHHDHDHDHGVQTTEHGPETQSDEARSFAADDISDPSMYVPRTVEGELKIDNEVFTPDLQDSESQSYREFTSTFSDALKRALFDRSTIERGNNEIMVEVVKLREGSVIVRYRIHWKPKPGMEVTENLLTPETLQSNLNNYLDRNNRMISTFHVAEGKVITSQVLDICKISKYDCQYECVFDERTLDFTCICPPGHMLDMTNLKKCVPLLGNSNEQVDKDITNETEVRGLELMPNPRTKSLPEEEKSNTESVEVQNGSVFDWKESHHQIPETTTQSDTDVSFSHIFGNGNETPAPEPAAEPKPTEPVPAAEPKPEPEPASVPVPEPTVQPEPASEPAPTSEPQAVTERSKDTKLNVEPLSSEPAAEPQPTSEPASEPEPTAEPAPEPQPAAEPALETTAEPVTEHGSESQSAIESATEHPPEPASEPVAEPAQELAAEPAAEHATGPAAEPAAEPTAEPAAEPGAIPDPNVHDHSYESVTEPASAPEPTSEPNADSGTSSETKSETVNSELSSEQQIIPVIPAQSPEATTESKTSSEMESNDDSKEDETNTKESQHNDMNLSAETTTRISISEPNLINEPSYEAKPEIVSILSETKHMNNIVEEETEATTTSEWLESDKTMNEAANQASIINGNHIFEQRSFSSYNNEFETETTTEKDDNKKEADISFEDIHDNNKVTTTSIPVVVVKEEIKGKTTMFSSNSSELIKKEEDMNSASEVNTSKVNDQEINNKTDMVDSTKEDDINVVIPMKNDHSVITTIISQSEINKSNDNMPIETTTVQEETVTENSIQSYLSPESSNVTEMLLDALSNKKIVEVPEETTTAKNNVDDSTDITFDNINNFNQYNRSSKSFENDDSALIEQTELTDTSRDSVHTTESEWLSVPVTEVNYNQVINNVQKEETTLMPIAKIEEVINQGVTKDDFEPDYLNGMSPSSKMTEADVPMYGITHDYDNEDFRFKRVDNATSEDLGKPVSIEPTTTTTEKMAVEKSSMVNVTLETTTISQYIYETAGIHNTNISQELNETNTEASNVRNINPAPVWEESEVETKKEMTKVDEKVLNEITTTTTTTTEATTTTTAMPTTSTTTSTTEAPKTLIPENIEGTTNDSSSNRSVYSQNSTKINNFGVMVYEVSSHSNQSTTVSNTTNSHSAEYEDHEVDMNPFLPEVENNKHLVKTLQEGHDLEPNNLNETQNENVEEHPISAMEGQITSPNSSNTQIVNASSVININASVPSSEEKKEVSTKAIPEKETVPAFLADTEDLLQPEWESDEYKASKTTLSPSVRDSEYLSVVPIEQEKLELKALKKDYESRNLQGLNDISDSPKKSEKRTLDVTKLESVTNNEA